MSVNGTVQTTDGFINPVEMQRKAREILVAKRTVYEREVKQWHDNLMQCSKEKILDKIPFDYTDMSLKTLIPELYEEIPKREIVDKQFAEANMKFHIINCIVNECNQEGLKLIQEYLALEGA